MAELKPKSFRIDEETSEKFKEISQAMGENQQETLARLIQTYELEQAKLGVQGHTSQIEQIQQYTTAIVSIYMNALQTNQDLRATVYEEFSSQLKAKDSALTLLQERLDGMEQEVKQVATVKEENEKLKSALAEKEAIISKLMESQSVTDGVQAMLLRMEKVLATQQVGTAEKQPEPSVEEVDENQQTFDSLAQQEKKEKQAKSKLKKPSIIKQE